MHTASKSIHKSDGIISNHEHLKLMHVWACGVVKMLGPEPTNTCVYAWVEEHEEVLCGSRPWRILTEQGWFLATRRQDVPGVTAGFSVFELGDVQPQNFPSFCFWSVVEAYASEVFL